MKAVRLHEHGDPGVLRVEHVPDPGGRLATCGEATGPRGDIDLRALFVRQISLLGSYMGSKGELREASRHLFGGRLALVIDTPLDEAAAAHVRLEAGARFGRVVLAC